MDLLYPLAVRKNIIDSYNFYLLTKYIKSVVNKNENKYYYDIFLEKVPYKNKWMFLYHKCDVSGGVDVNKTSASK